MSIVLCCTTPNTALLLKESVKPTFVYLLEVVARPVVNKRRDAPHFIQMWGHSENAVHTSIQNEECCSLS